MSEVIVGVLCALLGALACYLIVRFRSNPPDTPAARAEVAQAEAKEETAARERAAEVKDAPVDDLAADIERLRARGRAGK